MFFRVGGEGPTAPQVASAAKPDGFVGRFGFGFGFGASRRSRDERGRRERAPRRSREGVSVATARAEEGVVHAGHAREIGASWAMRGGGVRRGAVARAVVGRRREDGETGS